MLLVPLNITQLLSIKKELETQGAYLLITSLNSSTDMQMLICLAQDTIGGSIETICHLCPKVIDEISN